MGMPPLGNRVSAEQERRCTRLVGGEIGGEEILCGKPATTHMLWTPDLDNGMACDEHVNDFKAWKTHTLGSCCAMPGSLYFDDENRCGFGDDGIPVAEPVREIVLPVLANPTKENTNE